MLKQFFIIILISIPYLTSAQYSIRFYNDILDEAIEMAKKEGKKIFIDSYAPWCVPCKKMNKTFRDPKLVDYFNKKFINVKINMDGRLGSRLHTQFQVVFLPTLLFLDSNGNVVYRNDRVMSKSELLAIGKSVAEPEIYIRKTEPKGDIV